MQLLAARLDAVVYSLGLARTRRQARQIVNHGHIEVDGKRVDIPSYTLKPGQEVSVREKSAKLDIIAESVEINNFVPDYLEFDADNLKVNSFAFLNVVNYQLKSMNNLSLSTTQDNKFSIKTSTNFFVGVFVSKFVDSDSLRNHF